MKIQIPVMKWPALLLTMLSCAGYSLQAQVNFQFMPAINGQTINGLYTAQIQNTGLTSYYGKVKITVRDDAGKTVLVLLTPALPVKPGNNLLTALMSQSRIQFGNAAAAGILNQTGRFPEGEYEYCFEFAGAENKTNADEQVFDDCFNYLIQPMLPLSLVYPADGDQLCNTRPALSWQPGMPLNSQLRYRLMLTEKGINQQASDAMMNNIPVLQQDNIPGCMLLYPSQAASLEKDKNYVWQVVACVGNTKLTQSEIGQFSTKCGDRKIDSSGESYRELSGAVNGNFYVAGSMLRFTIINPYSTAIVAYSITDLADPSKKIENLPPVKVQTGLNSIAMETADIKGLEPNKMYLLKIKNIGNQPLYLRFLYKGDAL